MPWPSQEVEIEGEVELTEKQLRGLRRAWDAGVFSVPKEGTYEEVAEGVGVSPGTFANRVRRGLADLLDEVVPQLPQPPAETEMVLVTTGGSRYHRTGEEPTEPACRSAQRAETEYKRKPRNVVIPTYGPCKQCYSDSLEPIAGAVGETTEQQQEGDTERVIEAGGGDDPPAEVLEYRELAEDVEGAPR